MAYPANTVDSDAVAQDQIRAFVERIMRMREEAKAINDDIREIYAEAKGNGFDKTILGKLVLYIEKRGKDEPAVLEQEALFDLYLEAFYERPSRTHAHEGQKSTAALKEVRSSGGASSDAKKAETETNLPAGTQAPPVDTNPVTPGGPPAATVAENVTVADQATEAAPQVSVAPSSRPLGTTVQDLSADAGTTSLPAEGDEARHQINAGGENVDHAAHNAGEADAASPAPAKRQWKHTDKPHADCLNPSQCGGFSNLGLCPGCKEAAAQGQVA